MKKLILLKVLFTYLTLLSGNFTNIYSQVDIFRSCGFNSIHNKLMEENDIYKKKYFEYEKSYLDFTRTELNSRNNPVFTLPVVVHIIHNGGAENITDDQVIQGIENLNEAYANIGYYDQNTGVATGFQFCLAQQAPDGTSTTGINRVKSSLTNMDIYSDDNALKNLIRWDPYHYINIWLVKDICSSASCSVVGYATFPSSHGSDADGLVIEASYFGGSKSSSAVQVHEMGHYLGLFHTFQGGCKNDNCLTDGDKVCDTPPDNTTFPVNCGDDFNSCYTDTDSGFDTDQNDMYWNYMDYGDFHCYSAFTEGQRTRMAYTIKNIRKSLLDSKACTPICPVEVTADFSSSRDTFYLGETVNFINLSSNNALFFSWQIDGNEISTDQNLNYTFQESGIFIISLIVYNNDRSCYDFINKSIVVLCPAIVEIKTNTTIVLSGDNVHFEAISGSSNIFEWYIDDNFITSGQQFDYIFDIEGTYNVKVISKNNQWNCADTASTKIVVSCPVKAEFKTSAYFPELNKQVHFTNTSINANFYKWKINDQFITNNKNLDYSFASPGEYSVCLTAENGNCKKEFCIQIFVVDSNQVDCDDTYVKRIGDPNIDERAYDFGFINDNSILVVGGYNNQSLIFILDNKMQVSSSFQLDFLSRDEYIYNAIIDNAGYLLISGIEYNTSNGRSAFIAKYDLQNKSIIWKKKIEDNKVNYPIFWNINQLSNNNYLIGGKTYVKSNDCDALIMELESNTGNIVWHRTFNTGSCEGFLKLLEIGNSIYGTGRFALSGGSQNKFRAIISKMDNSGSLLWAKNYLFKTSNDSRIYSFDMIQDNGLVTILLGDETGSNLDNSKIQIIKTDLDGNLLWAKGYYVPSSKFDRVKNILNFPDGYLIAGDYKYSGNNRKLLLFKIDKSGNILWKKSYKVGLSCEANSIKYKNGFLYFMGTSINNNDEDIFVLKLDINGNIPVDCENIIEIPNLTIKTFNNFSEDITIYESTKELPYFNSDFSKSSVELNELNICKKECFDSCSIVPDASIVLLDAQCAPNDSFVLRFEVCNPGNFTLPPNTPIAFYENNPVFQNSKLVDIFAIPDSIQKNDCKQYSYIIKTSLSNSIYCFINDNGSLTTPFAPDQELPNTGILECNWNNNLSQIDLNEAKSNILDLGNDTTMCISGIVTLNAGSGFESYKWNDSSTDSIFTAWNPGKYWVEVIDYCGNIQRDEITITIDSGFIIDLGEDLSVCAGDTVFIDPLIEDICIYARDTLCIDSEIHDKFPFIAWGPNVYFKYDSILHKFIHIPDKNFKFIVNAQNNLGCFSNDTIDIKVIDKPDFKLPNDTTIYLGDKILIIPNGNINDNLVYKWQPPEGLSCTDCFSPEASPLNTTTYTLEVMNENGCSAIDDIVINVKKDISIYIPNVFTPNGDGINDIFYIRGKQKGIRGVLNFKIYDRWGELIYEDRNFQINDSLHGWDGTFKGKKVNPDVFVYIVIIELIDGTEVLKKGDITVLR